MPHALQVAFISEPDCIGCALCLKVCPTDAILGASKQMHTVIADDCTGCRKCVPVCPTDCIAMLPRQQEAAPAVALASRWRSRYRARRVRLVREQQRRAERLRRDAKPKA